MDAREIVPKIKETNMIFEEHGGSLEHMSLGKEYSLPHEFFVLLLKCPSHGSIHHEDARSDVVLGPCFGPFFVVV